MDPYSTPFYGWKILHCTNILRCVYPFIRWWAFPKGFENYFLLWTGPRGGTWIRAFPLCRQKHLWVYSFTGETGEAGMVGGPPNSLSKSTPNTTLPTPSCHSPSDTLIPRGSQQFQWSWDSWRALLLENKNRKKCRWGEGGGSFSTC